MALLKYKYYYINYIYSFTKNKIEKTYLFGKFFHYFFIFFFQSFDKPVLINFFAFINYNKK